MPYSGTISPYANVLAICRSYCFWLCDIETPSLKSQTDAKQNILQGFLTCRSRRCGCKYFGTNHYLTVITVIGIIVKFVRSIKKEYDKNVFVNMKNTHPWFTPNFVRQQYLWYCELKKEYIILHEQLCFITHCVESYLLMVLGDLKMWYDLPHDNESAI